MILTSFMSVIFIVLVVGFCLHKKDLELRLTKLGILLFLIFFLMFPNPLDWGNQIYRRIDRQQLIEPSNAKIALLNETFYVWYSQKNDTYFGYSSTTEFTELNEVIQVKLVQFFLYNSSNPEQIIDYSYDFFNPPRYAYDHLATVDEILGSNFTSPHSVTDDCDGIAVITCSLLIHMGYDAFIAEGDFHWWTIVFINGTRGWSENNPVRLNWLPSVEEEYCCFNEKYIIITQPITLSIVNVLSETGGYVYGNFYYDFLMGEMGINTILGWTLLVVAFLILSSLMNYFLNVPRRFKLKKRDLANILFGWVFLILIGFLLFLLVHFDLAIFGHLLVFSSIAALLLLMDRRIPEKIPLFNKLT
ncbi:MAG: hypothetical protein GF329_11510 [Candidatus Lokiarchaeota archaeon]|nr:hypothetical protein [Candidatus Lokiarchaeota archaeon]